MKKAYFFMFLILGASAQSDTKAVDIATKVMKAMGGQNAYDQMRHVSFNFFGNRRITWDKYTGNVRVDQLKTQTTLLYNTNTKNLKAFKAGIEIVASADSIKKLKTQAEGAWINDTYWLLMPFKMKDPGVSLKYIGEEKLANGLNTDVIEMTFAKVGITPDNKYLVYVDKAKNLVCQWAFFKTYKAEKPDFLRPWAGYARYGKVLLASNRGDRELTDIRVFSALSPSTYSTAEEPQFNLGKEIKARKIE